MPGKKLLQAPIRWPLVLKFALTVMTVAMPEARAQHTSAECSPQTATFSAGGTVTIDDTDYASSIGYFGFGALDGGSFPAGGLYNFPDHGAAFTRRVSCPFSNISMYSIGREELMLGGRLEMPFLPGWALALEYIGRLSAGAGTDNMIQMGIKHEFSVFRDQAYLPF